MFNLDGFILKLCNLAQQMGDDVKIQHLRAAGLQVLSSMVTRILHGHMLFCDLFNASPFFNTPNMKSYQKSR